MGRSNFLGIIWFSAMVRQFGSVYTVAHIWSVVWLGRFDIFRDDTFGYLVVVILGNFGSAMLMVIMMIMWFDILIVLYFIQCWCCLLIVHFGGALVTFAYRCSNSAILFLPCYLVFWWVSFEREICFVNCWSLKLDCILFCWVCEWAVLLIMRVGSAVHRLATAFSFFHIYLADICVASLCGF